MLKSLVFFLSFFLSSQGIATEQVMKVVPIKYRLATEIQSILTPLLENSERVISNRSSLIVKATPERQKELLLLISQLDTRLNNLLITVIQSHEETAESLNAHADIRLNAKLSRKPRVSTQVRGYIANTSELNHSNRQQKILTLEGHTALIKTGQSIPVEDINIYQSQGGYTSIASNTHYLDATTGFLVTPRLSRNQVTLEISPWSNQLNQEGAIQTQSSQTTILTQLGKWVEIGGSNEDSQSSGKGILSYSRSTNLQRIRTLVKVEKQ